MNAKVAGMSLQERYEKNPLIALKLEALPPSIIQKLKTEPADFIGPYDHQKREEYIKQNALKLEKCKEVI